MVCPIQITPPGRINEVWQLWGTATNKRSITMNTSSANQKLSVVEKVGYSLGDLAANLIFQILVTFLAYFYTDVYGVQPKTASSIMFIAGVLGACFNPIMGMIVDRTNTRWGKFRPWLLWTPIPFALAALLTFTTPDFGDTGKVIYAFCTYLILLIVYSANNLPYAALSGVLTGSMSERNSLSSYRFVAVMIAQFIIQALLLPIILILGNGDKVVGFHNSLLVFSIFGIACFLITFFTTTERIIPTKAQSASIREDVNDLIHNLPWRLILIATFMVFITLSMKGGGYVYYFKHYLDESALASFLQNIGFNNLINDFNQWLTGQGLARFEWPQDAATSAFSLFNGCGIIMMIIGIGFSKSLSDKYGKRNVFGSGLFLSTIFVGIYYIFPKDAINLIFISQILHGFFYGITVPLLWAMIADVADYSEWRNNRRATAIIFSAMIFGLKIGLTIGGALLALFLGNYGYDATLPVQSQETKEGIKTIVSIYASIPFLIACGCLFFYEINKQMESKIEMDLNQRRKAAGK